MHATAASVRAELLPHMHSATEFGVRRTNRFDTDGEMMRAGQFDWL